MRQTLAAHKLVLDENGEVLYVSKECFSNGCAVTVDVSYPSIPLFLIYNPELVKGMIYKSVAPKKVSFKKGRGGTVVRGDAENASLISAAVFDKVYINEHQIENGKFILYNKIKRSFFMKVLNFGSLNIDHVYAMDRFENLGNRPSCQSIDQQMVCQQVFQFQWQPPRRSISALFQKL